MSRAAHRHAIRQLTRPSIRQHTSKADMCAPECLSSATAPCGAEERATEHQGPTPRHVDKYARRRACWLLTLALLCLVCVCHSAWAGDWDVRRKDRWQTIAARLFALFTARPQDGYALRRLVQHFRRKGGVVALQRRLFKISLKRPKDRKIQLAQALLWLHVGQYSKASKRLQLLLKAPGLASRQQRQLRWHLARAYFREQRWGEARRLFVAQLGYARSKARKRKVLQALIQLDTQRGAWKQARGWYQQLLVLRPRDLELRLGLAQALARQKLWKEAIAALQQAMPLAPQRRRPELWSRLVRYHMEVKQYPQALAAIEKARRLLMPTHWLHNALTALEIDAHRSQNTLPALIETYRQRSKRNPKRFYPLLARLHVELGQIQAALTAYQALLKRIPRHPAFTSAVALLLEQKRTAEAISWLQRRLRIMPKDEASSIQLLGILHREQKLAARDQLFASLLKQYARNEFFLQQLSSQMQTWKDAFSLRSQLFRRLCGFKPQKARCFELWGDVLWKHNKKAEARRVWEQIRAMTPLEPDDLFLLAEVYQRHQWDLPSLPLLLEVIQLDPRHTKARRLLARIYMRLKRYRTALPQLYAVLSLTRSLRLREHTRLDILRALHKVADTRTLQERLQRDLLLAPFAPSPRKMLLTYHLHFRRTRVYTPRYRHRYIRHRRAWLRRYFRRRWGRRHPAVRTRSTSRSRMISPEVQKLLQRSLQMYPDDPEFHILALKVNEKKPAAWEHLRRLVMIDLSQTERYVRLLKAHARKYHKGKSLVALLQQLATRWPYQATFWGHLGEVALQQKDSVLGCQAFSRALQLAPKQLSFRMGHAQCLAAQDQWKAAHRALLQLPHPHQSAMRKKWLLQMTLFGLKAGLSLPQLLLVYQRRLSQPAQSIMSVLYQLQARPRWNQSPPQRKLMRQVIQSGWPMWKQLVLQGKTVQERGRALLFLFRGPPKQVLPVLQRLLKEPQAALRSAAILAIGLLRQKQLFYLIDQAEQSDRSYDVKVAAKLAAALLADQLSTRLYYAVSRWSHLRPWAADALKLQSKQIEYRNMLVVAHLFNYSQLYTRWRLLRLLEGLTGDAVIWLGKMRTNSRYRCFAFDALSHLQRPEAPRVLRDAALQQRIYPQEFKRHCRKRIYGR